jgi:hypothetical protein
LVALNSDVRLGRFALLFSAANEHGGGTSTEISLVFMVDKKGRQ